MLLEGKLKDTYLPEIRRLNEKYIHEKFQPAAVFAIIEGNTLQAYASAKCYMGHWYLRSCVVKPAFRGRGLQRQLIRERLDYLRTRTDHVRVSILPANTRSIHNIEAEGFQFENMRTLPSGKDVRVYKRTL